MSHRFTNRLVTETSPYLRQHAHNPVDWYPWGEEALQKAAAENKLLLISIGYAACHWCHVMERECFEKEDIAAFMNEHFVNVKIDREERPDLDHIYMDAVQAISGSGGWPLNVFCTPDARPFFGGTYYPPVRAYNRISWPELLQNISHAWDNEKDAVNDQAARLLGHISSLALSCPESPDAFTESHCRQITAGIMQQADTLKGGFGTAPKFPHASSIRYLFEFGFLFKDPAALQHAESSLRQLIRGGIYDHVGGGMSRYSTDDDWLVPHFEKMLYDNAMLMRLLSDGYQLTGDDEFRRALYHTFTFLLREMKGPAGGYYSALDADSEGVEGKYYVWKKSEIDAVLGSDAALLCDWFGVIEEGNWEDTNILHLHADFKTFAAARQVDPVAFEKTLTEALAKLLNKREQRIRPGTDDKVISGWNAMLLTSFCRAYAATGDPVFKSEALALFTFLKMQFFEGDSLCHMRGKEGKSIPAFADDLAFWIEACIHLQEITGDQDFLREAIRVSEQMDNKYLLPSGYFSYSSLSQADVLFPRPEYYDGAFPSANAVMAQNLHYLSVVLADKNRELRSASMISGILNTLLRQPVSYSSWGIILMYKYNVTKEVVIFGPEGEYIISPVLRKFIPNRVLQTASRAEPDFPLLIGKKTEKQYNIYLCINNACQEPFADISLFDHKFGLLNN